jgi:hypothetical protein
MFGSYAILEGKKYDLEKEPDWFWEFKVVTSMDEVSYSQWQDENIREVEVDGKMIKLNPMGFKAAWRELALSFLSTNIPGEDGEPILSTGASIEEVEAALKIMPGDLVAELWKALQKVYPFWGPRLAPPEDENSGEIEPSQTNSES